METGRYSIAAAWALALATLVNPGTLAAHCDRENGPVAADALEALATGDVDHALIWVGEAQETELRSGFRQSLAAYQQGGAAKDLAEQYFMEATVRLHREAEGMPFAGLKPAQPSAEDIQIAERALATGDLEPVQTMLSGAIEKHSAELFERAVAARQHQDESVAAGRAWVDAYVKYIVYVHGLHQTIEAGPAHGVGE